jgi:hypothetical protein
VGAEGQESAHYEETILMEWTKHLVSGLIGGVCGTLLATLTRRWIANWKAKKRD